MRLLFLWILNALGTLATTSTYAEAIPSLAELLINGHGAGSVITLLEAETVFLEPQALASQNIHIPNGVQPVTFRNRTFIPLDTIPGLTYRMDKNNGNLVVQCSADCFKKNHLEREAQDYVPTDKGSGTLLNYHLLAQREADQPTLLSGFSQITIASGQSHLASSFAWRNHSDEPFTRVETSWTHAWPASRHKLLLGDTVSSGADWASPMRYAGIKWGTDFSLQPGFIHSPQLTLSGETLLPSTVEVYIDNIRRMQSDVPAGAFTIDQLPTVSGEGEAQIVVRDILGREQVSSTSFYAAPTLLKTDLSEYSIMAGTVRSDNTFGTAEYGDAFTAAMYNRGITNNLTLQSYGEISADLTNLGAGAVFLVPGGGLASFNLAASLDKTSRKGSLAQAGYEYRGRAFKIGVEARLVNHGFRRPGMLEPTPDGHRLSTYIGIPSRGYGSWSFAYTEDSGRQEETFRTLNLRWSTRIRQLSLSLTAIKYFGESDGGFFNLSVSLPLGAAGYGGLISHFGQQTQYTSLYAQKTPTGKAIFGYRAQAQTGDQQRYQATLLARPTFSNFEITAAGTDAGTGWRLTQRGSITTLGDSINFGRLSNHSYAVVEIPDVEGVRVYKDNHLLGRTDDRGKLFVPNLRPYEKNQLRVEPLDLPFGTSLKAEKRTVRPPKNSGVLVQFLPNAFYNGTFILMLENGQFVPPGSTVTVAGSTDTFFVGSDGRTFLEAINTATEIEVDIKGRKCHAEVVFNADGRQSSSPVTCRFPEPGTRFPEPGTRFPEPGTRVSD